MSNAEDSAHQGQQALEVAQTQSFKGSDVEKETTKEYQVGALVSPSTAYACQACAC